MAGMRWRALSCCAAVWLREAARLLGGTGWWAVGVGRWVVCGGRWAVRLDQVAGEVELSQREERGGAEGLEVACEGSRRVQGGCKDGAARARGGACEVTGDRQHVTGELGCSL